MGAAENVSQHQKLHQRVEQWVLLLK